MWKYVHISVTLKNFQPNSKPSRFHRAMTRPFFSRERISDFDIYDKNCASTLKLAKTRLAEGYPVEFQVRFFLAHQSTPLNACDM